MKKQLFAAMLLLSVLCSCAFASGTLYGAVVWTECPTGYVHFFSDCTALQDEADYPLILGSLDEAESNGKEYICRLCYLRLAHKYDVNPSTVGQNTFYGISDNEISYFASICEAELLRRSGDDFILYPGVYIVGQDIPAGSWRMELIGVTAEVAKYSSVEEYKSQYAITKFVTAVGDIFGSTVIGKLELEAGSVLAIDGTFRMCPYTGVKK